MRILYAGTIVMIFFIVSCANVSQYLTEKTAPWYVKLDYRIKMLDGYRLKYNLVSRQPDETKYININTDLEIDIKTEPQMDMLSDCLMKKEKYLLDINKDGKIDTVHEIGEISNAITVTVFFDNDYDGRMDIFIKDSSHYVADFSQDPFGGDGKPDFEGKISDYF